VTSHEAIVASWETRGPAYARLVERWPLFATVADRLVAAVPEDAEGIAVDVAAGSGLVSSRLLAARPRLRVHLIEPAASLRGEARASLARVGLVDRVAGIHDATAETCDRTPIRDARVALCSAAFHLLDDAPALRAVARLLAPDGAFLFNLWGHSVEETAARQPTEEVWREPVRRAIVEAGLSPPAWPDPPPRRVRTLVGLGEAANGAGLEFEAVCVDRDSLAAAFYVEFQSMTPGWLDELPPETREPVTRRARALASRTFVSLDSLRVVLRKARG